MLNKLRQNPIFIVVWILIMSFGHLLLFRPKVNYDISVGIRILSIIVAIVSMLFVHEVIHLVCMMLFGGKDSKIEFAKDPMGIPSFRAISRGEFKNWQLVIIFLAPFVLLTVVFDIVFVFVDSINLIFFLIAISNSAGAYFDIIDALRIISKSA